MTVYIAQVLLSGDAQMKIENTELCKEKGRFQLLGNFEILESTYGKMSKTMFIMDEQFLY